MATTSKMNIQKGILPDADPVLWFDVEGVGRLDAKGVVGDIQTTVIGDVFDQSSESLNILVADFVTVPHIGYSSGWGFKSAQ